MDYCGLDCSVLSIDSELDFSRFTEVQTLATSTPAKHTSEARHVPEDVTLGDMQAVAPHITTSSRHDGPVCTDKILARVQCTICTYSTTASLTSGDTSDVMAGKLIRNVTSVTHSSEISMI